MKIKTQFIICIVVFSAILLIIGVSVAITEQQVSRLSAQEQISSSIERGASSLNSRAIDYFLYQEDLQLSRWQSTLSSLSSDLSNLEPNSPQQQTLANNVADDLQRLNSLFDEVSSYLQSASRNVSVRIDPPFQIRWSSMAVQSQALAFDASQLSLSLDDQSHQVNNTNTILIVSLVGVFGAFLVTIYLMVFRRTLKSVADLQNGIYTIGSGNLEYVIETKREDEIAELSHSFNQMTTNLKSVTASKMELEQEIMAREKAEAQIQEQLHMLEYAPVIVKNMEDKIICWNSGAQKMYGFSKGEVLGKVPREVLKTEFPKPIEQIKEEVFLTGRWEGELVHKKADGSRIFVASHWILHKDNNGKPAAIIEVNTDITERKKLEKRLQDYAKNLEKTVEERTKKLEFASSYARRLIEASLDPLVTISAEGKITDVNKATELATGCSREELIGSDFSDYFVEPEKAKLGYHQ